MRPSELLNAEHLVILRMLDCLDRFVDESKSNGSLKKGVAQRFVDFIREYADKHHHAKEEDRLFPMMIACGIPGGQGPIPVMLQEHDNGRICVGLMAESLEGAEAGDAAALERFCESASDFAGLLRDHIDKEDLVLYPMGDQAMTKADQEELAASFDQVESRNADLKKKYETLADELGEKYGVPKRTGEEPRNMPGCHGGAGCM